MDYDLQVPSSLPPSLPQFPSFIKHPMSTYCLFSDFGLWTSCFSIYRDLVRNAAFQALSQHLGEWV